LTADQALYGLNDPLQGEFAIRCADYSLTPACALLIRYQGGKPFGVTALDSFEPSLANTRDGRSNGFGFLLWENIHDYLLVLDSPSRDDRARGCGGPGRLHARTS
jgi:hypothetical protein